MFGAVRTAAGDVGIDAVHLHFGYERAELAGRVQAVAQLQAVAMRRDVGHHLVEHAFVNVQARAGRTDLPAVEKDGGSRAGCSLFQVGIGEHEHRRLATQLQRHLLEIAKRGLHDAFAGSGGAGERDLVDIVVRGQRGACARAKTGHDIDHAIGETRLLDQLAQPQCVQRRLLGRLQHDGAADRQCGRQFPDRHRQRKVPRDDLSDYAYRFAQRVGMPVAWYRQLHRLAIHLGGPTSHVADHVGGAGDATLGARQRLAVVDHFEFGQFVAVLLHQVG